MSLRAAARLGLKAVCSPLFLLVCLYKYISTHIYIHIYIYIYYMYYKGEDELGFFFLVGGEDAQLKSELSSRKAVNEIIVWGVPCFSLRRSDLL